ncbi:MAG TPA: ABC transporter substrate-binding protein [Acidimicrobiales bacterium]|nr:ABC transporter substrate-binding protein [Acidimicrobiales bacterium]
MGTSRLGRRKFGEWRRKRSLRKKMSATAIVGLSLAVLAATGAGAATVSLVTNIGNGGSGELVTQGNNVAHKDLIGPKGSGLTQGVTSSSITVGCVYTAADFTGFQAGIQARFNQSNSKGGVDGRKLTLIPCKDDASSVQTNVTENQQLVTQNNVFAVMSLSEDELSGSTNFLSSHQVPYYGWGFNPGFCGYRWGFGWNGCLGGNAIPEPLEVIAGNLSNAIVKASGLAPSKVRFAVQSENSQSGLIGNAQYTALFHKIGSKIVYAKSNYPVSASGVDNTPYAQAIVASDPNIVYLSTPFADVGPLASAIRAAGYKGIIMDFTNYIPGLLQTSSQLASALQGEYVNTQLVPSEQNTAYDQQIATQLGDIGQPKFVTEGAFFGYAEADLFVQQLEAVGHTLNTKTFDQKINDSGFASFTASDGGPGKLVWPAGHYLPSDCASIVKVVGTNYQVVTPFSCYQSYKIQKG